MKLMKIGRIALRREGPRWNAYWALPDSLDGAIFLGSVPMAAAEGNPAVKDAFMKLMREVVSTLVPGATWPNGPTPAPENERSGNA